MYEEPYTKQSTAPSPTTAKASDLGAGVVDAFGVVPAGPGDLIGAIVAAALVWFAVTVLNAPGQREDPGVTVIMGGIGVAFLGVALIVLVLRMLLAQAVARDVEAARMQAELDEVI